MQESNHADSQFEELTDFVLLTEKEKNVLDLYSPLLARRSWEIKFRISDWLSKKQGSFPDSDFFEKGYGFAGHYRTLFSSDYEEKRRGVLNRLMRIYQRSGIMRGHILAIYDFYRKDLLNGIASLGLPEKDTKTLRSAVMKRLQFDKARSLDAFYDAQKRKASIREFFYETIMEANRIYSDLETEDFGKVLEHLMKNLVSGEHIHLALVSAVPANGGAAKVLWTSGLHSGTLSDLEIPLSNPDAASITNFPSVFKCSDDPYFASLHEIAGREGFKEGLSAVFRTSDRRTWNVSIYGDRETQFLEEIGDLFGSMADDFRRFAETRLKSLELAKLRNYQRALEEIQRELLQNPSPEAIYGLVVKILEERAATAEIHIAVSEPDSVWLKIVALGGKLGENLTNLRMSKDPGHKYGNLVAPRVLRTGVPIILENADTDPDHLALWADYPSLKIRIVGGWPIFVEEKEDPVAALVINSDDPVYFTEDLQKLIEQMVSSVSIALRQNRQKNRLEWMSLHDHLTALPNRSYFERSMDEAIAETKRNGNGFALGIMDLDDFKEWNDILGHMAGDRLLKDISVSFRENLKASDVVARLGGDEFVFHVSYEDPGTLKGYPKTCFGPFPPSQRGTWG